MLIYFYTPSCEFCGMMEPVLEEMEIDFPDIDIIKINIAESNPWGINAVPTFMLEKDGDIVCRIDGPRPKNVFYKELGLV